MQLSIMSIFTKIFGLAKIPLLDQVGSLLDELHHSGEEKAELELAARKLDQAGVLKQLDVNKTEVQHRSVFVAGWRPFVGWVCGLGLLYHYLLFGLLLWVFALVWPDVEPPPQLDIKDLLAILSGMLGLSWMRSQDKEKKSTKD